MTTTSPRLSRPTISLHWIVAFGMIGLLGLGFYMTQFEVRSLYGLHKSLGVALFAVILVRVMWRMIEGWPEEAGKSGALMSRVARAVHWVLILGTLALPVSGMVMSVAGGRGLETFGMTLVSANIAAETGRAVALNANLAAAMGGLHTFAAYAVILTLVLHIAGALKHHVLDRDATLRRMLPGTRQPSAIPAE